jgi:hypothetical protein
MYVCIHTYIYTHIYVYIYMYATSFSSHSVNRGAALTNKWLTACILANVSNPPACISKDEYISVYTPYIYT